MIKNFEKKNTFVLESLLICNQIQKNIYKIITKLYLKLILHHVKKISNDFFLLKKNPIIREIVNIRGTKYRLRTEAQKAQSRNQNIRFVFDIQYLN